MAHSHDLIAPVYIKALNDFLCERVEKIGYNAFTLYEMSYYSELLAVLDLEIIIDYQTDTSIVRVRLKRG